ncbi:MAG: CAP domain-containing protein [Christensenellales bacterium]|jgi:uncharacterized protein YkwD
MRSRMCAALLLAALLAVLSACSKQPVRTDRTSPSTLEVASGQYLPAGALLSPGPDSNQTARAAVTTPLWTPGQTTHAPSAHPVCTASPAPTPTATPTRTPTPAPTRAPTRSAALNTPTPTHVATSAAADTPAPTRAATPAATPAPTPTATPDPTDAVTPAPQGYLSETGKAYYLCDLANEERVRNGLHVLEWDDSLAAAAHNHCLDMAENQFFSHVSPTWGGFPARIAASGVSYSTAGENLACIPGYDGTTSAAHQALMRSTEHRENILSSAYTRIGIAAIYDAANDRCYFVQWFAG